MPPGGFNSATVAPPVAPTGGHTEAAGYTAGYTGVPSAGYTGAPITGYTGATTAGYTGAPNVGYTQTGPQVVIVQVTQPVSKFINIKMEGGRELHSSPQKKYNFSEEINLGSL